MTPEASDQVEIWKKIVDVQQHFNDLELRIRNFALIVTGAFIGLGGYALKDGGVVTLLGVRISVAGLVVFCALLPLVAFYLMDRLWYHRLLMGAVKAASPVEARLRSLGIEVDLGGEISRASPFKIRGRDFHSKHKMDWFYRIIAFGIVALALVLAFATEPVAANAQGAQVAPRSVQRGAAASLNWNVVASIAQVAAAIFAGLAAIAAWRAASNSNKQAAGAEAFQREQAIDAQWMRYQDFYKDTIGLYAGSPGMALDAYEKCDGEEKRRLHLAAIALLQTLDLAYRAGDEFRANNLRIYLQWNEGPLATVGAIDAGALKHKRTFEDWNVIRRKHGKSEIEIDSAGVITRPVEVVENTGST